MKGKIEFKNWNFKFKGYVLKGVDQEIAKTFYFQGVFMGAVTALFGVIMVVIFG